MARRALLARLQVHVADSHSAVLALDLPTRLNSEVAQTLH